MVPAASRLPHLWPPELLPSSRKPQSANTTHPRRRWACSHRYLPLPQAGLHSAQRSALHSQGRGGRQQETGRQGSLGPLPVASRDSLWPTLESCVASKGGRHPHPQTSSLTGPVVLRKKGWAGGQGRVTELRAHRLRWADRQTDIGGSWSQQLGGWRQGVRTQAPGGQGLWSEGSRARGQGPRPGRLEVWGTRS